MINAVLLAVSSTDQYLIMVAITLLFSILAISRKSVTLYGLAWICWYVAAGSHLLAGAVSSPLSASLTVLYFGIGSVFFVMVWVTLFGVWKDTAEDKHRREIGELP